MSMMTSLHTHMHSSFMSSCAVRPWHVCMNQSQSAYMLTHISTPCTCHMPHMMDVLWVVTIGTRTHCTSVSALPQILEDLKPASVLVIGSSPHLEFVSLTTPSVPFLRCAMTSSWKEAPPTKCPLLEAPNFIKGEAAARKLY